MGPVIHETGPDSAKQPHIMTPPPPCWSVGLRCSCWSPPDVVLVSSVQRMSFQKSAGWFRCSSVNVARASMFCLNGNVFPLETLPEKLCWFSLLTVLPWPSTSNMFREAWRLSGGALGVFRISLSSGQSDFGVGLLGPPVLNVSYW